MRPLREIGGPLPASGEYDQSPTLVKRHPPDERWKDLSKGHCVSGPHGLVALAAGMDDA